MDKGKLKNFAAEARRRLISHISARIAFVLTNDTAEFIEKAALKEKLRTAWEKAPDRDEFIERHAYTLFNRLIALRFMDVRGYNFVPVVTPRVAGGDPGILADARTGIFQEGLPVDRQKISDLLTGKIPVHNPFNESYKLLFVAACGWYNKLLPFMFEPLNSYTELLLPDDLLSTNSIISFVNQNLGPEECENVEVIGWLYQYYISEKKDEASKKIQAAKPLQKREIMAYTQIFTPKWIVKYLVENSVGRLWLKSNKSSKLDSKMKYLLNKEDLTKESSLKVQSPEDLRLLDPSAGSGHILVYMFELLMEIYLESGYYISDIPELIIKNNLFGLDIDSRAVSLASFALMMKAREYDTKILDKKIIPNIFVLNKTVDPLSEDIFENKINADIEILGSLLRFEHDLFGTEAIDYSLTKDLLLNDRFDSLGSNLKKLNAIFGAKFHCVVTNPPYLNPGVDKTLKDYVQKKYPVSKYDLFACFIEKCIEWTVKEGYTSLVTMQSWMFLSSFEKFRTRLLQENSLITLGHFENMVMGIAFGTSAFTFAKSAEKGKGQYYKVTMTDLDKDNSLQGLESIKLFDFHQSNFSKIPGSPIAYWVSERVMTRIYESSTILKIHGDTRQGMATSDNERFLRFWYEVTKIKSILKNKDEKGIKWFPYNKGGQFKKWYGNQEYVVNWEHDGREVLSLARQLYNSPTRTIKSISEYFKECISWSKVTSSSFAVRYYPEGFIFDVAGCCIFYKDKSIMTYHLALLNSCVVEYILKMISPTINFEAGSIANLPLIYSDVHKARIEFSISENTTISRLDWDSRETSWDFKTTPLLLDYTAENPNPEQGPPPRVPGADLLISEQYNRYKAFWTEKFFQLHCNEEELNRIFIEIYGLQEELTPDVELKDVTILQPEKIITPEGGLEFKTSEVVRQFISWSVGCMFGRYSPDKPGLILANQGETLNDFLERVPEPTFLPDEDNIIPVLDDEYFSDDIVARFKKFVETIFGRRHFTQNIRFIEESLGMDIRKYFVKEFHKDHMQRYKKRPIYWLVTSPGGNFNALIYMHRYNNQTMSKIFNDYLKEFRSKIASRMKDIQDGIYTGNNPVREEERLRKQLKDVEDFILTMTPFAMNPVDIDLDDGVKVNIAKFAGVVRGIQ